MKILDIFSSRDPGKTDSGQSKQFDQMKADEDEASAILSSQVCSEQS